MKNRYILAIIWLMILLSSCVSGKRAAEELRKPKHKLIALELCADLGEIKESITTETDTVVKVVTLPGIELDCPETINTTTGEKYTPKVKCPDVQQEVRYINTTQTVTKENTYRVDLLKGQLREVTQDRDKIKDERKKLIWFGGILMVIAAGLFTMLIRK